MSLAAKVALGAGAASAVAAAASEIASVVKSAIKSAPAKKKKKNIKNKKNQKQNKQQQLFIGPNNRSFVRVPSAFGVVTSSSNNPVTCTVPFSTTTLSLKASATGVIQLHNDSTTHVSSLGQVLNPTYAVASDNTNSLGFASAPIRNICGNFVLWRFKRLVVEWVPLQPSSYAGVVAYGYIEDAANTAVPNLDNIGSLTTNVSSPVWQPVSLDITPSLMAGPIGGYYEVDGSSEAVEADYRLECQGSFYATYVGPPRTDDLFGYFRFTGMIELRDIADSTLT